MNTIRRIFGYATGEASRETSGEAEEKGLTVESITIYPIKSCKGVALQESKVVATGLEFDRQYMLATLQEDGSARFLTQRECPRMSLLGTSIFPEENRLELHAPGHDTASLPLRIADACSRFERIQSTIWKHTVPAYDTTSLLPTYVSAFLGVDVVLLYACELRDVLRNAPTKEQLGGRQPQTAFADYYPVHILLQESFDDLHARVPHATIDRFRMNLVIAGRPAWDEDTWKRLRIGGREWHIPCRNVRCAIPDVDPLRGERDPEARVMKAMQRFRRVDPGAKYLPCVGVNALAHDEVCTVRVGDPVEILQRGDHHYIPI